MKHTKRLLALLVAFCLIMTSGACSGGENSSSQGSESSKQEVSVSSSEESTPASQGPEAYSMPICEEKISLSLFSGLDSKASVSIGTMEDNYTMQYYESISGIHIEFFHPSSATSIGEALNVMISSGEYTDMIGSIMNASDGPDTLIENGVILRLNEPIDQYGYYLGQIFEEYPEFYNQVLTYEGNIALYPTSRLDPSTRYFESFVIRQDWLDQLGLEKPTTVDEWYTVLKAFATQDPNGNGQNDELPFVGNSNEQMGVYRLGALFGFNACFYKEYACSVLDGKITFASEAPQFEDYITTMARWYAEGLIDPEYASTDATSWQEKVLSDLGGCFYGKMNGGIGTLLGSYDYENRDSDFNLEPLSYAVTDDGASYDFYSQEIFDQGGIAVSTACEHIKEAVQWLDYMYSDEGQIMCSFGEEGVTFAYDDQGVPHYTEMITEAENLSLVQAIAKYTMGGIAPRMVNDIYYWDAVMSYDQQRMVYDAVSPSSTERKVPQSLKYSMEDQDRLTMLMGDIQTYYQETLNAFIMGTKPISELQDFRDTLKSMGLEEAIGIMQASYDSYIANNA